MDLRREGEGGQTKQDESNSEVESSSGSIAFAAFTLTLCTELEV